MVNIKSAFKQYSRVLQIARKPSKTEFVTAGKISALGLAVIGFIGFIIFSIFVIAGLA